MSAGYAEVFAKELTFRYKAFLDAGTMDTIIPTDYVHTFLIRHPRKTLTSLYGLGYSFNGRGPCLKGFLFLLTCMMVCFLSRS